MRRKIIYVVIALLIAGGGVFLHDYGYNDGYDNGYAAGNQDGHEKGYDEGYEAGWYDAFEQVAEDLERDDYNTSQQELLSTDDAPAGSVFVTPSGEKYHVNGCQYLSGRYDLRRYDSAEVAAQAGYGPCSVCH